MRKKLGSGFGAALGILLCGLCFIAFPKVAAFSIDWLIWTFNIIGFVCVLIGVFGGCIEFFP